MEQLYLLACLVVGLSNPDANGDPRDPRPIPKAIAYIVMVIRNWATKTKKVQETGILQEGLGPKR